MHGRIDISKLKVPPEKHELDTARYFAALGYDIEFIPPSNIPEVHTPDIKMNGVEWEIKCPKGSGRNVISRNLKRAAKQSHRVIIDLRRSSMVEDKCISEIERRFKQHINIKQVLVIKKDGELLDIK